MTQFFLRMGNISSQTSEKKMQGEELQGEYLGNTFNASGGIENTITEGGEASL